MQLAYQARSNFWNTQVFEAKEDRPRGEIGLRGRQIQREQKFPVAVRFVVAPTFAAADAHAQPGDYPLKLMRCGS
jgi:hypothetical protein